MMSPLVRANGILVLGSIVLLGLGSGAAYYQIKRPSVAAGVEAMRASTPTDAAERVARWLDFGAPNIHHRLSVVGRFSTERPWLVTHALPAGEAHTGVEPTTAEPGGAAPFELWGVRADLLPVDLARQEGLTVVVDLPVPERLGRSPLTSEAARFVPVVDPAGAPFDAAGRLHEIALHLLEGLPRALAEDIPGARLELEVGGRAFDE
jgi:hypothetical protein